MVRLEMNCLDFKVGKSANSLKVTSLPKKCYVPKSEAFYQGKLDKLRNAQTENRNPASWQASHSIPQSPGIERLSFFQTLNKKWMYSRQEAPDSSILVKTKKNTLARKDEAETPKDSRTLGK